MTPFGPSVFITGANRGIGLEFVRQFIRLQNGPKFIFAGCRNPDTAEELKQHSQASMGTGGVEIHVIKFDISDEKSIEVGAKSVERHLGKAGLNLLINNAGIMDTATTKFPRCTQDGLMKHFLVNTVGTILTAQAFYPLLKKAADANSNRRLGIDRAASIQISSEVASIEGNKYGTSFTGLGYNCSKAALNLFSKMVSIDLRSSGVLFVSLHPGWLKTEMGGPNAPLTVEKGVSAMLKTFQLFDDHHNGKFVSFDGKIIPY